MTMQKPGSRKKDLRIFELIWAAIFFVIAAYPVFNSITLKTLSVEFVLQSARVWALYVSGFFFLVAVVFPVLLEPFYVAWVRFGEFVGAIISKVILCFLFYGLFAPIGIFFRIIRKDLLKRKLDSKSTSYWINRETQPGTMKNQY